MTYKLGITAMLVLVLGACGQQQSDRQGNVVQEQEQMANVDVPTGEGWVNLGDGVYKRVSQDGGISFFATYKVPSWVTKIESMSQNVAFPQDSLSAAQAMLSVVQKQQASVQEVVKQNGENGITQLWAFTYALRASQSQNQVKQLSVPINALAVTCSPNANSGPTSGGVGAKATAYISCSSPTNIGAEAGSG